jgi:hypothetical protein
MKQLLLGHIDSMGGACYRDKAVFAAQPMGTPAALNEVPTHGLTAREARLFGFVDSPFRPNTSHTPT